MTPDRLTRRGVLTAAGAAFTATVVGGSATADADRGGRLGAAARAFQEDDTDDYASVYRETIDDVVLVNVFGEGPEGPGGLGSGFVTDDGYVVTNDHVVAGASEVELQFRDEQWRTASVVGTDVHSDLAVLAVDDLPDGPDGLSFTDADPVIGQEVLALGNPLGFDASISQGIVSGIDRSLPSPTGFAIPAAIQTDAPVNPGNSGGPLVTLDGDVLGVVFAGAGQTIGFAISAALADRVVPALVDDGEYEHAYMGVGVLPVGPLIAEANDLDEPQGVLVIETDPDGPADGVLEPADETAEVDGTPVPVGGDVIVAIGGEEIPNQDRLSSVLALETSPGDAIDVDVVRDGERQSVELTLAPRPDEESP
ncbi:S1C family serine protease [Halosolutus amylolyticus]|uniref:S1C family serine protease n=1 Tax=Halosolutus amylolyticus TaxID=2932267 RepID=A0ABD5PU58_9EURY|nr:trypsin-like peptidase domain-containing protein [Halosolutus amylolyticus]